MKNAVVWPETARVAIMRSTPNPAGGILNLIGATRGKLCGKSRPVRRRLSQNSFIQPRHIRKYVQWPPEEAGTSQPIVNLLAAFIVHDDPGVFQNSQMLANCCKLDSNCIDKLADAMLLSVCKLFDDPESRRVPESLEHLCFFFATIFFVNQHKTPRY